MLRKLKNTLGATKDPLPATREPPSGELPSSALDSTAFPHIFDRVFTHASYAALLRLRATSRSLRDRVDTLLCQHMVLWGDELRAGGRHPAFAPLAATTQCTATGRWRLPHPFRIRPIASPPTAMDTPLESWSGERQRGLLGQTRVFDWTFFKQDADCHHYLSDSVLDHLDTIRVWDHEGRYWPAPNLVASTLVMFGWPGPYKRPPDIARPHSPYTPWFCNRHKGRIVINWSVENTAGMCMSGGWIWDNPQLVIVFAQRPPRTFDGQQADEGSQRQEGAFEADSSEIEDPAIEENDEPGPRPSDKMWRTILQDVTPAFGLQRSDGPPVKVTFVNASVLPPLDTTRWYLFFPETEFPGVRDALRPSETLESLMRLLADVLGPLRSEYSFLSLEAYKEEVGDKQFMLDTQDEYMLTSIPWTYPRNDTEASHVGGCMHPST